MTVWHLSILIFFHAVLGACGTEVGNGRSDSRPLPQPPQVESLGGPTEGSPYTDETVVSHQENDEHLIPPTEDEARDQLAEATPEGSVTDGEPQSSRSAASEAGATAPTQDADLRPFAAWLLGECGSPILDINDTLSFTTSGTGQVDILVDETTGDKTLRVNGQLYAQWPQGGSPTLADGEEAAVIECLEIQSMPGAASDPIHGQLDKMEIRLSRDEQNATLSWLTTVDGRIFSITIVTQQNGQITLNAL